MKVQVRIKKEVNSIVLLNSFV